MTWPYVSIVLSWARNCYSARFFYCSIGDFLAGPHLSKAKLTCSGNCFKRHHQSLNDTIPSQNRGALYKPNQTNRILDFTLIGRRNNGSDSQTTSVFLGWQPVAEFSQMPGGQEWCILYDFSTEKNMALYAAQMFHTSQPVQCNAKYFMIMCEFVWLECLDRLKYSPALTSLWLWHVLQSDRLTTSTVQTTLHWTRSTDLDYSTVYRRHREVATVLNMSACAVPSTVWLESSSVGKWVILQ